MKNINLLSKYRTVIVSVALLLLLGLLAFLNRQALDDWAFQTTGEVDTFPQARALGQLLVHNTPLKPLNLSPQSRMEYADVNPYGINTFLHQEVEEAKRERQIELISEAGFTWLREEFPWEDIEIHARGDFTDRRNNPDGVDAWAKYDHIVGLADQYDLQLIVRLSNPPQWSRSLPEEEIGSQAPPDVYGDFARFAAITAERYKGRVSVYQVWNEPNIYPEWGNQSVSPEDYTDLLCQTYAAIKAVDENIIVVSGALAPTIEINERDFSDFLFLQRMYDAGAGDCFDVMAVQGYLLWSGPTDQRMRPTVINFGRNQFIRDIMVRNGDADKAIWMSEMNSNAAPEGVDPRYGRVTLEQQAAYAALAYQHAEENWPWMGVINFWYFKRADSSWLDEQRPEAYFQMSDPDFNLMPVYGAMQAQTSQRMPLYAGHHKANHWALEYGEGWTARSGEGIMLSDTTADPLRFAFEGNRLKILSALDAAGDPAFRVKVDGRDLRPNRAQDSFEWRGRSGLHEVVIEPIGDGTLSTISIRNESPLTIPVLLLLAGFVGLVIWADAVQRGKTLRQ